MQPDSNVGVNRYLEAINTMRVGRFMMLGLMPVLCQIIGLATAPDDLAASIRVIRAVGPEGRGNVQASAAWLAMKKIASCPRVLMCDPLYSTARAAARPERTAPSSVAG